MADDTVDHQKTPEPEPEPNNENENGSEPENGNKSEKSRPDTEQSTPGKAPETPATDANPETPETDEKTGKLRRLAAWYWSKKRWSLPLSGLVLLVLLAAVPYTRYALSGLVMKERVTVSVVDAATGKPVSGVSVALAGQTGMTDASGKLVRSVPPGVTDIAANKQYYKAASVPVTVTFSKRHNNFTVRLTATGRRVPVRVVNAVTGKSVAGVTLTVLGTSSRTDTDGKADVVLPTTSKTQKMVISANGYNTTNVVVQVTDQVVEANTFKLVPSGKLYFLSNQSGKIDVVKTNLDGSAREVVLAGTGNEDPRGTSLLASRDWKYLALLSKRTTDVTSVTVIDTTNQDKTTGIDDNSADKNASFSFVGWEGDTFIYDVNRANQQWQPKQTAIKSYNAATQKLNLLYETDATGDQNNYAFESVSWIVQVDSKLVWFSSWTAASSMYTGTFSTLEGKSAKVYEYDLATNTKKAVKTLDSVTSVTNGNYSTFFTPYSSYQAVLASPGELYFVLSTPGNADAQYEEYADGKVADNSDDAQKYFLDPPSYKTYLLSPLGDKTFWSESRDGKSALFVGDEEGQNGKQITVLSDTNPYGWFGDSYLLLSKKSSELYIMPVTGGTPFKITDYYKPDINYSGYGGGYGGN